MFRHLRSVSKGRSTALVWNRFYREVDLGGTDNLVGLTAAVSLPAADSEAQHVSSPSGVSPPVSKSESTAAGTKKYPNVLEGLENMGVLFGS